jgi:hypothetical protein
MHDLLNQLWNYQRRAERAKMYKWLKETRRLDILAKWGFLN